MGKVFDLNGKDLTKTDTTLRVPEAPADAAAVGKKNDEQTESLKAEKSRAEGAEKKLQQQVDTLNAGGLNLKEDLIRTQVDSYLTQHPEAMGAQGPKGDKGDPGEGFTSTAKELMLSLFENASYKTGDAQDTLNALRAEWGGSAQDIPVQSVALSSSTLTLNEGESKTLTATVLPANATDRTVVWSVSPAGFATVVNGEVTATKAGTCTVTATAGGKSASCAVTVKAVEAEIPVQSVALSSSTLTLNEGESKTLTATVLPANATGRVVVWSVSPAGFATVVNGKVTGDKAGSCTVTATAGGKSASCAVTVAAVETAELIYDLPGETTLSIGFDTGLKLLEYAATETPQYTILLDLKPRNTFEATTSTQVLYCVTKLDQSWKTAGFNLGINPNEGTLPLNYYMTAGPSLCDTIEHFKMRTRYVIQIDGTNFRGGSTHCALSGWKTAIKSITNVPESMIIGGARDATSSSFVNCLKGTLYQCKVYKGLLSDAKVKAFIEEGTV